MEIIPAIDIIDGKCVRLTRGDYSTKKEYSANPIEIAKKYEDKGVKHLHLVDLDGAKQSQPANLDILSKIASQTDLFIDWGGGIKTEESARNVLDNGADQITAGSIAVKNKPRVEKWLDIFGSAKIILGADIKEGKIAVDGWQNKTEVDIFDFVDSYIDSGIEYVICTDISKDGMLEGPAIEIYSKLVERYPKLKIIASGGVSTEDDLNRLQDTGVHGVIVGKAIYENKIDLDTLVALSD